MANQRIDYTFGFSIDVIEVPDDPQMPEKHNKYKLRTGRYPSPSFPDPLAVANAAVDFLNGHFGTKFVVVEPVNLDEQKHFCGDCGGELQIVRPGKYQCVSCEGAGKRRRKKKVKNEQLESVVA